MQQAIWGRHKDSIKDVLVALGHFALPSTSERERSSGKRLIAASAGHGIALVCVAAALSFSLPLQSIFPYPFLFLFFAAVMASAWFGGTALGFFPAGPSFHAGRGLFLRSSVSFFRSQRDGQRLFRGLHSMCSGGELGEFPPKGKVRRRFGRHVTTPGGAWPSAPRN